MISRTKFPCEKKVFLKRSSTILILVLKDLSLSKKDNMDINIFKNLNKKNINIKYDHNIYEHALKIYNNFH